MSASKWEWNNEMEISGWSVWMWTSGNIGAYIILMAICNRYGQEREWWRGTIERLEDDMCEY